MLCSQLIFDMTCDSSPNKEFFKEEVCERNGSERNGKGSEAFMFTTPAFECARNTLLQCVRVVPLGHVCLPGAVCRQVACMSHDATHGQAPVS